MLTRDETYVEVDKVIQTKVDAEETFTPYDVTKQLRADGFDVEHLFVRERVRNGMFAAIQAGLMYEYDIRSYPHPSGQGTVDALTFYPIAVVADDDDDDVDDTTDDGGPAVTLDTSIWSF